MASNFTQSLWEQRILRLLPGPTWERDFVNTVVVTVKAQIAAAQAKEPDKPDGK